MADDADRTQERMEVEADFRSRQRRATHALPKPNGRCLNCGEITAELEQGQPVPADTPQFCDQDCRQDWDRENTIRARQGLA